MSSKLQYKFDKDFNESLKKALDKKLFYEDISGWLFLDGENVTPGEPSRRAVYLKLYVIKEHSDGDGWRWPRRLNCKVAATYEGMKNGDLIFLQPPITKSLDPKDIKRNIAVSVAMAMNLKI